MEKIQADLQSAVLALFQVEVVPTLTLPPAGTGADYASNVALSLAKTVGRPARSIAEAIASELVSDQYRVEVAGPGFLNFISRDDYFIKKIAKIGENKAFFNKNISQDAYKDLQVVTEFSDPNPFKVLHVGHLYTSVVGEAISKLIETAGATVHRANFGGDVGMHVAKTMWSILRHQEELARLAGEFSTPEEKSEFMAKCYVEGSHAFDDDDSAKAEITALNKQIYDLVASDSHDSEIAKIYWQCRAWSYEYFDDFYAKIGVKFEKYYPESSVAGKGLAVVGQGLKDGIYTESDGAVVFQGEPYGLHTRVFINNMGLPTYEAKDVGLSFTKWQDYQFDESIIITGNDIIDYMKVVLKSISMIEPRLAERTVHLTHGNVRLPGNEKMSSRKGNFLKAMDVLSIVKSALKDQYGKVDDRIAMAALKYAFLKYKMGGNIIFDVDESVSMTGNSGPYLQYSAVRAKKILEKVGDTSVPDNLERILAPSERSLIKQVLQYPAVLKNAISEKAPHKLCSYLYELAQEFSRFYEATPVAGSDYVAERAQIVRVFLWTMEHGLGILGIETPEEM